MSVKIFVKTLMNLVHDHKVNKEFWIPYLYDTLSGDFQGKELTKEVRKAIWDVARDKAENPDNWKV